MKRLLAPVLVLLFCVTFYPQSTVEWQKATDSQNAIYYFDAKRLRHVSETIRETWIKEEVLVASSRDYASQITLQQFDCKEQKTRLLSVASYDFNGQPLVSGDGNGKWVSLVPESVGEGLLIVVCAYKDALDRLLESPPKTVKPKVVATKPKTKHKGNNTATGGRITHRP